MHNCLNLHRFFFAAFAAIAATPLTGGVARADAVDTLAATTQRASVNITIAVHGQMERDDLAITAPLAAGLSVIKLYDTKQYIVVDDRLKSYAVLPLASAPLDLNGIPDITTFFQPIDPSSRPTTHAEQFALTVVDEGVSEAPGFPGSSDRHYSIGLTDTSDPGTSSEIGSGLAAKGDGATRRIHTDLWVDPRTTRPVSPLAGASQHTVTLPGGDKVIYTITGDVAAYDKAMSYLPVEMFGNGPGQAAALKQITAISAAPVNASRFEVPASYKQLTLDAFATAESDAILDMISGPQPKLPNAQPSPSGAASSSAGAQ